MKKYYFSLIAVLSLFTNLANATKPDTVSAVVEPAANRSMAVSLSPTQLFMMSVDGKFIYKLDDQLALTFPVVFQFVPDNSITSTKDILFTSAGAGVRYQFAGSSVLRSGFFLEGSLALGYTQLTPTSTASFSSVFLRPTATVGYTWAFDNGLALNFAAGAYYNHAFSPEASAMSKALTAIPKDMNPSTARDLLVRQGLISGLVPTAEISLSFAW